MSPEASKTGDRTSHSQKLLFWVACTVVLGISGIVLLTRDSIYGVGLIMTAFLTAGFALGIARRRAIWGVA